jgi:hypothetical protein
MMLKRILELPGRINDSWLIEKKKFMELEKGYDKNTNLIEVKWLHDIAIADDEFGSTIVGEDGNAIVEEIYESHYIDTFGYCWSSDFVGSLSQNNEMIDDDGWIFPVYNLPEDLKTIADPIIAYLVQGIDKSRHEQVGSVLQELKLILEDSDNESELKTIRTKFYNKIKQHLKKKYPFFFDELATIKEKNSLKPKLSLWHCEQICRFTIDKKPFISRKIGPEHLTQGKLLHHILTTPNEEHSHLKATLMSQEWSKGDVYYLIIRLKENFSGIEYLTEIGKSDKLLFGVGVRFNYGSFRKFKSQNLVKYEEQNKAHAERICQQIAEIL